MKYKDLVGSEFSFGFFSRMFKDSNQFYTSFRNKLISFIGTNEVTDYLEKYLDTTFYKRYANKELYELPYFEERGYYNQPYTKEHNEELFNEYIVSYGYLLPKWNRILDDFIDLYRQTYYVNYRYEEKLENRNSLTESSNKDTSSSGTNTSTSKFKTTNTDSSTNSNQFSAFNSTTDYVNADKTEVSKESVLEGSDTDNVDTTSTNTSSLTTDERSKEGRIESTRTKEGLMNKDLGTLFSKDVENLFKYNIIDVIFNDIDKNIFIQVY